MHTNISPFGTRTASPAYSSLVDDRFESADELADDESQIPDDDDDVSSLA